MEKVEIRHIGRQDAIKILNSNLNNRKVTRANVDFIKREMIDGNFAINGSTIVISKSGNLLDGQHRLIALSETELSYDMIFVLDADDSAFKTIDTGKNRCGGDILSIEGVKNANNVSSTIRKVIEKFGSNRKIGKTGSVKLSNTEILDYYNTNKDRISESVDLCMLLYCKYIKVTTVSNAAAFMLLFSQLDKNKSKSFIRELFSGVREGDSNAALTLRHRLINGKISGTRINDQLLKAFFIISFKAYMEDRDISKIQISKNLKDYVFYDNKN